MLKMVEKNDASLPGCMAPDGGDPCSAYARLYNALSEIAFGGWSRPNVDSEAANTYARIVDEMQSRARMALLK